MLNQRFTNNLAPKRTNLTTRALMTGLAGISAIGLLMGTNVRQAPAAQEKTPAVQNWQASVNATETAGSSNLDPKTLAVIDQVNAYFNKMTMFKGRFVQTNPDNEKMKGRFYVKRPGMMRFDYSPPSKLRIVSNGKYLSIEDHDLRTVDRYPLDATPFGILLAQEVNLLRDAKILEVTEGEDYITLTIEDKASKTAGQIKLFFAKGELELKEWIITDPQGLNTKIEVAELQIEEEMKTDFFALSNIDLQKAME